MHEKDPGRPPVFRPSVGEYLNNPLAQLFFQIFRPPYAAQFFRSTFYSSFALIFLLAVHR